MFAFLTPKAVEEENEVKQIVGFVLMAVKETDYNKEEKEA